MAVPVGGSDSKNHNNHENASGDVHRATGGLFRHAAAFGNDSESIHAHAFRELRTQQVIKLGWRTEQHLINGHDTDRYDHEQRTITVVLLNDAGVVAGARVTKVEAITDSLSACMWDDPLQSSEVETMRHHLDGGVLDITRMLFAQPTNVRSLLLPLFGALWAARPEPQTLVATVSAAFARLLHRRAIGVQVVRQGLLGDVPTATIIIPPDKWISASTVRARRALSLGAWAVDPGIAPQLPFWDPALLPSLDLVLTQPPIGGSPEGSPVGSFLV